MKMRQRHGISLATLVATLSGVALLLLTMVLGAGAAAGTKITIGSGSTTVGGNTNTTVSVTLDPADATFNGFDITISFDKSIGTANSVSPGAGWTLIPAPVIDNAGGTVRVVGVRFDTCASPCTIFSVNWLGVAGGISPLQFQPRPSFPALSKDLGVEITPMGTPVNGTLTITGPTPTHTPVPPTDTPVNPTATNTPIGPTATNTPVTPTATNTPIGPTATNTPVTPGTSTPTGTTAAGTPTNTATGTATGTQTPQGTATGTTTPQSTSSPTATGTATATPIPGGPRIYKLYLPHVADDGIPGSGQLVRDLGEQLLQGVLGSVFGGDR